MLWKHCQRCGGFLGLAETMRGNIWWTCPACGFEGGAFELRRARQGLDPALIFDPRLIHNHVAPEVVENHEAVGV